MDHSFIRHQDSVNSLCRICGNLCLVYKKNMKNNDRTRRCDQVATDLLMIFEIDISEEKDDCYSKYLCSKCYVRIKNIKRTNSASILSKAKIIYAQNKDKWCPYNSDLTLTQCAICSHRCKFVGGCVITRTSVTSCTSPEMTTTPEQTATVTETYKFNRADTHRTK